MHSPLSKYAAPTYALMRIVTGFLFLCHGGQILFGYPAPGGNPPAWIHWIGGPIELIGGALVAIGLFTGWAAFVTSGTMAVAYWYAHGLDSFFPLVNHGELAALYCFVFLYISAAGSGIWSVDALRGSRS
jgi:putative oxidoreductase